ncbi:MAG: hypothetical protein QOJ93_930 [Actinomycetota bacterium]|jgi:hypothetical protein|nr:hypothetical protein [Actinomycetota bacterium]
MGSEIVGRTVRVPNGVNVAAGLVGLGLIAFSLLGDGGWPLSVFIGAIGVLLAGVALANHAWFQNRATFVISDEGVAAPLGHMPLLPWREISAVSIATTNNGRSVSFDAVDPDRALGARPALPRVLGRLAMSRTSTVLWIPEAHSPVALEDLVREIDNRYEAAVGRPLPPHPIPEPLPRVGIVEGFRKAGSRERRRILLRIVPALAVLFLYVLLLMPSKEDHVLVFICLLPVMQGFAERHPWGGLPVGLGRRSSFRREAGIALLLGGVAVLALAVKALAGWS